MVVADEEVAASGVLQIYAKFGVVCTVNGIAINVRANSLLHIDTSEVLMRSHRVLGDVVALNCRVAILRMDTFITGNDAVVDKGNHIALIGVSRIVHTVVAARQNTI